MSGWLVGGVAGLIVLAYLLWSDRHRLIETNAVQRRYPHLPLLVVLAGLVGFAAGLLKDNWPDSKPDQPPTRQAVQFEVQCMGDATQPAKQGFTALCKGTPPDSVPIMQETKQDDLSGKLELTFAALGIFIALVTAISLAVAKNATDEARRAEEQARTLRDDTARELSAIREEAKGEVKAFREEMDYISQARLQAVRLSLQRAEIQTIAQLARSSALISRHEINPTPLLEEKLNALDEMLRWQAPDFDADGLARQIDTLIAILDNTTYRPHLKHFFDQRDREAYEGLIEALNKPVQGTQHPDRLLAAKALGRLLRKLRSI